MILPPLNHKFFYFVPYFPDWSAITNVTTASRERPVGKCISAFILKKERLCRHVSCRKRRSYQTRYHSSSRNQHSAHSPDTSGTSGLYPFPCNGGNPSAPNETIRNKKIMLLGQPLRGQFQIFRLLPRTLRQLSASPDINVLFPVNVFDCSVVMAHFSIIKLQSQRDFFISSNTSVISFPGAFVQRLTITLTRSAAIKAGRSS